MLQKTSSNFNIVVSISFRVEDQGDILKLLLSQQGGDNNYKSDDLGQYLGQNWSQGSKWGDVIYGCTLKEEYIKVFIGM